MAEADSGRPRHGCPFASDLEQGGALSTSACSGDGRCGECERSGITLAIGPGSRYRVEGFIASGYYADVFRATDVPSGRAVALKVFADEPPKRDAWTREVAALTHLSHPRIPRLWDAFEQSGWLCAAMDLVEGVGLRETVEREGSLPVDRVIRLGIEVAEVLGYIAAKQWTYRDLHPRNIFVGTPRGAMMLDFDGARPPGWPARPSGRIGYRAPELEEGGGITPACDVFSLAGCLFFALTREDPPFTAGPLSRLNELPKCGHLAELLDQCRSPYPESRPSAAAVRRTLISLEAESRLDEHWR